MADKYLCVVIIDVLSAIPFCRSVCAATLNPPAQPSARTTVARRAGGRVEMVHI
jgi:hypothetical protein